MGVEKVAVVTGANRGIGFEIVKGLCKQFNGTVYLTTRTFIAGITAIKALKKLSLKAKFYLLDVTSHKGIQTFAEYLQKEHGGIDVLVNNAAVAFKKNSTHPFNKQAQITVATNYYALLLVCEILFPLLRPHARVVNMSSSGGVPNRIPNKKIQEKFINPNLTEWDLNGLMMDFVSSTNLYNNIEAGWGNNSYVVSKIGVTALTFIQHRQFLNDSREDIVVNCVHPGFVNTEMNSHQGTLTPEQGAKIPLYLALLPPNVSSPRGEFVWSDGKVINWLKPPTGH